MKYDHINTLIFIEGTLTQRIFSHLYRFCYINNKDWSQTLCFMVITQILHVSGSHALQKHTVFWSGQIPAGQTSPKGTISEMAARAFYCCLYAMGSTTAMAVKIFSSITE